MKPPVTAASPFLATELSYFNCVEMLVKLVLRVEPIVFTAAMITTEMPAAMRPYSIAVAPDSSFRNEKTLDIRGAPCCFTGCTMPRGPLRISWTYPTKLPVALSGFSQQAIETLRPIFY